MVLGLTYRIKLEVLLICFGIIGYRIRVDLWRLHSWPCTQRSSISFINSWTVCFDTFYQRVYLRLHIHEKSLRRYAVIIHGIIGYSIPCQNLLKHSCSQLRYFFFSCQFYPESWWEGTRDIWTYTYARWFHADNWDSFLRTIIFFRESVRWR